MITSITIRNFKSIAELSINCSSINLLIGTNSSGKSTVIQSLLFLSQNLNESTGMNGDWFRLGSFDETRCRNINSNTTEIIVTGENGARYGRELQYEPERDSLSINRDSSRSRLKNELDSRTRMLQYISCTRMGPSDLYPKNMSLEDERIDKNGRYAFSYLLNHQSDNCWDSETLMGEVNHWLEYIVGARIQVDEIEGLDRIRTTYSMNSITGLRPTNIGSGISYVITILITCLSAPEGGIILIENPEIHLHPSAQSRLCTFFDRVAASGRQIFIESHSDHLFNGFRAAIADGSMSSDRIAIQFLSLDEAHCTVSEQIQFGPHGRIINQRENLFDQFDIDLNRMLGF